MDFFRKLQSTAWPLSMVCLLFLELCPSLALSAEVAQKEQRRLKATWIATEAEREGKPADDVVGHRLSFSDNRFRLQSQDGKLLSSGIFNVDPSANPATIDFEHREGPLQGKTWKGIYTLHGDVLKICDNAPNLDKNRPGSFGAASGSGLCRDHL